MALSKEARKRMEEIIEAKKNGQGLGAKKERPEKSIKGVSKPKKMKKNGGLFDK